MVISSLHCWDILSERNITDYKTLNKHELFLIVQKRMIYLKNADKLRVINRKIKIIIHIFMNNF